MKSIAGVVILAIVTGFGGCILWPVNKKDVIGVYQAVLQDGTPGLPDGGSEILELKPDGSCIQQVRLKDGRVFSAQGTWEWGSVRSFLYRTVITIGIYSVVDGEKIDPDFEKIREKLVRNLSVGRTLTGRIILGSDEGSHYEKK